MTEDHVYELMAGALNDELNAAEEERLRRWLAAAGEHASLFDRLREIHLRARAARPSLEPDVERALRAVKRGKRRPRWGGFSRYAALLLLALGAGWWFHVARRGDPPVAPRSFETVAVPGHTRALLKRGDGDEMALGELPADTLLACREGVTIATDKDHLLTYSAVTPAGGAGEVKVDELIVPRGGEFQLVLPDGTAVTLNATSRLLFPPRFTGGERRVQLAGEACFDVARDPARPFIVETPGMEVKALGTRFNVVAYPDSEEQHATLVEGKVEVRSPGRAPVALLPGEQLYRSGETWEKRTVDVNLYLSWMKGKFMFRDAGLEEIARQLSRWYDVEIFFADEALKKIRFTGGIVRYDPVEFLIRMIESTSEARFRVEGKSLIIEKNRGK
ncbi:MAG: DUF4974 domain-containing protein [Odoribacteraceae bacterium]|jgi:ferric-dicitrate binding protein FerR (iron transport regulator)|nr:DUF4974 domain-containing protein [Odoribacteraceae bacterium]